MFRAFWRFKRLVVQSIAQKIPFIINDFRCRKNWPVSLFIGFIYQASRMNKPSGSSFASIRA